MGRRGKNIDNIGARLSVNTDKKTGKIYYRFLYVILPQ